MQLYGYFPLTKMFKHAFLFSLQNFFLFWGWGGAQALYFLVIQFKVQISCSKFMFNLLEVLGHLRQYTSWFPNLAQQLFFKKIITWCFCVLFNFFFSCQLNYISSSKPINKWLQNTRLIFKTIPYLSSKKSRNKA